MADYRRGFESLHREVYEPSLPTEGALPDWLTGTLIRNGPAQFEVGKQDYNHWFDGPAMLHAFRVGDGAGEYRNRFVESKSRQEALDRGEIARSEFATDPCMSALSGARSGRRAIFSAYPRCGFVDRAGACTSAARHPVRVPRTVFRVRCLAWRVENRE